MSRISIKNLLFLIPALSGILIYSGTFNHGYVLDDEDAIVKNRYVQSGLDGLGEIWTSEYRDGFSTEHGSLYRPLALTLFALEVHWFSNDAGWAHVFNVWLYGLCCALLFIWLRLLFQDRDHWLVLFICMLFVVHPIHTEVVANIKSADELLALSFGLIALISMLKFVDSERVLWLAGGLVAMFLGLTSKEGIVMFVVILPISLMMFRSQDLKDALKNSVWLIIPTAGYLTLRWQALGGLTGTEEIPALDNILVSTTGIEYYTSAISFAFLYLLKLIYPATLSHDYSMNELEIVGLSAPSFWLGLTVAALMVYAIFRWWNTRPLLAFALVFFLVTFSLYSNLIITIGTHFGERLMFVPSIGICLAFGAIIWSWGRGKRSTFEPNHATLPLAAIGIVCFIYLTKTMSRNPDWKDELTLFTADVSNAPNSTRTHYRLGRSLNKMGLEASDENQKKTWFRKAVVELEESVEIFPEFSDALGELGLAYMNLEQLDKAMAFNNRAIKVNPAHYTSINNIGVILFKQNKPREAITYFETALKINPNWRDPAGNIGSCYGVLGDYTKAIEWFKRAIEIDPSYAPNYYFIAVSYENMGMQEESNEWLAKAQAIDPRMGT